MLELLDGKQVKIKQENISPQRHGEHGVLIIEKTPNHAILPKALSLEAIISAFFSVLSVPLWLFFFSL